MTKLYRVTAFVKDLNGDCPSIASVIENIENNRHPEFIDVYEVLETDCGEWDDDHELNHVDPPYEKYFPDAYPGPLDEHLQREYRRVRQLMLQLIDKNEALERQSRINRQEIEKLKKVQEFVKTIGELTK